MTTGEIGVIGAGTMCNGIAQVAALAGLTVTMVDVTDAALGRGLATIESNLERAVQKGKLLPGPFVLQEGLASAEEIDAGLMQGCNHPIGPLALADMIGLDTMLAVMRVFHEGFGDPKYRPAQLLAEMVDAGRLGRKTGRGFFQYGGR